MNLKKLFPLKICVFYALLLVFSGILPVYAINPEPYLMTVLFDPGIGSILYLAYVSNEGIPELKIMAFNGSEWCICCTCGTIPDPQTAPYSPTMGFFQDKLWIATIANKTVNPEPVVLRAYNGNTWDELMPAPDYTIGALNPAISSYQYSGPLRMYNWLFLFWQTPGKDVYGTAYESIDGWLDEPFVVANETVDEGEPAACVYGSQLYVAWVSNDTILCQSFNGTSWLPTINPEPYLMPGAPSLAVHEDLLYLAYEVENNIFIQSFNGSAWDINPGLINPQPSPMPSDPAICSYIGSSLLYVAYVSQDDIYYQTYDGVDWASPVFVVPEYNSALILSIIIVVTTTVFLITKRATKKTRCKYG